MDSTEATEVQDRRPPRALTLIVCASVTIVWGSVHLVLFRDVVMPLTYALPLLLGVWAQNVTLVWLMATTFVIMATLKLFVILPENAISPFFLSATYLAQLLNISIAGVVVHAIIKLRESLNRRRCALNRTNLALATAGSEILRQNEELQSQAQELEHQNQELQFQGQELEEQAEELRRQSEELQHANADLAAREELLEAIFRSSTGAHEEELVFREMCEFGMRMLGQHITGAALLERDNDDLRLLIAAGVLAPADWLSKMTLAAVAIRENRTAGLPDTNHRPDLVFPSSLGGERVRSVLATPLVLHETVIGALEFYKSEPGEWTERQFHLAQWVAHQCSTALQTVRLRRALQESEQRHRQIFELAPVGIANVALDGQLLQFNDRLCELTGYDRSALSTKTVWDFTHPEDARLDRKRASDLVEGRANRYTIEKRYMKPDGTTIWVMATRQAVRDSDGRFLYFISSVQDIQDRKLAEEAQRRSEAVFRALAQKEEFEHSKLEAVLERIDQGLIISDMSGRILSMNKAALDMHELESREELQHSIDDFADTFSYANSNGQTLVPIDWPLAKVTRGETFSNYEVEVFNKRTRKSWIGSYSGVPVYEAAEHFAVLTLRDVTEQKRIERQREQHAAKLVDLIIVSTGILEEHTPQALLQKVVEGARPVTGAAACVAVYRSGRDAKSEEYAISNRSRIPTDTLIAQKNRGLCMAMAVQRATIRLSGDELRRQFPGMRLAPENANAISGFLVSRLVSSNGEPAGFLMAVKNGNAAFSSEDEAILAELGAITSLALHHLEARGEAEAANRAKDHFLAVLSHELRTPLNPALMASTLLQRDAELPAHLKDIVDIIKRNVELEARLIDDMLDLTRIARGKLVLNRRLIDGGEVLRHAIEICHAEASEKGLTMHVEASGTSLVHGDPARLQQVFWNLLKNAIKFTTSPGWIEVCADNTTDGNFRVSITDTGAGIKEELLPRLFDAFQQGGYDVTKRYGGLGLGLAICRGVVELHGGTITAESTGVGKGSTFTVEIPLAMQTLIALDPAVDGAAKKGVSCRGVRALRLLLVEDHESTAAITATLLRSWGHEVMTASCVAEAVAFCERQQFDLILSDLGLPDGSGCDMLRAIRAGGPVKAIAVSGYGMENDIKGSLEAGFLEHLTKPINASELEMAIQRVMNLEFDARSFHA